jgi:hypothetical protein
MIRLAGVFLALMTLCVPAAAAGNDTAAVRVASGAALKASQVPGMGAALIRGRHVAAGEKPGQLT